MAKHLTTLDSTATGLCPVLCDPPIKDNKKVEKYTFISNRRQQSIF